MNARHLLNFTGRLAVLGCTVSFSHSARTAEKSNYSWTHPTPASELRELSTDRPDATESPFTVDAGHVQVEASFATFTRDRHNPERDDTRVTIWNVAPVNVRIGLRHNYELQVVADNYLHVKTEQHSAAIRDVRRGFGDVTLRFKLNLWGNDSGANALAVMPFVKVPTNSHDLGNNSVEGGLIVPFAADLGGGFSFGAMTEIDSVRNDADDGYEGVWINTATIGYGLTEKIGVFGELAAETGAGKPAVSANTGVTYAVNVNLQLDLGFNFGVSRAADDLTVFAGFAARF